MLRLRSVITAMVLCLPVQPLMADESAAVVPDAAARAGAPMTATRMWDIVKRIDKNAERADSAMQFAVDEYDLLIVYDEAADRMRIVVPVAKVAELEEGELLRLMQANFDSALDARYAIARGLVWAVYIHPLGSLDDRELLQAVGETVNIVVTYGTSYSSGALVFGGGDSAELERRRLIERLLELGTST